MKKMGNFYKSAKKIFVASGDYISAVDEFISISFSSLISYKARIVAARELRNILSTKQKKTTCKSSLA